jgi:tetratricopeptide (TPR) repeat protein
MMLTGSGLLPAKPVITEFPQLSGGYAAVSSHLWRWYGQLETKADVLPAVAEHLQSLYEALSASSNPGLCAVHSETLQLSGEVLFDAGHHDDAISSYALAASAAKEARDYDRWATALVRWSLVLNAEERWTDSRELLTAAAAVAAQGDSRLPTRQWVASVRAEVAAAEGDASEAERALDAASTVLELTSPGGWLRYSADRLPEQRASAYLALGLYRKAEAELDKALQATLTPRRAAAILIDQARLRVRQGAAEAAREPVEAAAEIASRTKSDYVLGKLVQLQVELDNEPNTAELVELLSETTKGQ